MRKKTEITKFKHHDPKMYETSQQSKVCSALFLFLTVRDCESKHMPFFRCPAKVWIGCTPLCGWRMLDFGQFDFGQLAEIELAEVEIGRSRN